MLHAYDQRFDVTRNLENFCEAQMAIHELAHRSRCRGDVET